MDMFLSLCIYVTVMAGFIQTPVDTPVMLESTATFTCTATDVLAVAFLVNSQAFSFDADRGLVLSAPVYSGSQTTVYLYVPGTPKNNHTLEIVCVTYLTNGTRGADSRPAYLSVKG